MSILRYREGIADRIVELIAERNGGALPESVEEYGSLFERFGARLRWMPVSILREPMKRGSVIYLPNTRPYGRKTLAWLAHELAEVVLSWDGTRVYQGPGWPSDRHRISRLVERRLVRGIIMLSEDMKTRQLPSSLSGTE